MASSSIVMSSTSTKHSATSCLASTSVVIFALSSRPLVRTMSGVSALTNSPGCSTGYSAEASK
eukprot:1850-Heterococcus_DN1.PRE.1